MFDTKYGCPSAVISRRLKYRPRKRKSFSWNVAISTGTSERSLSGTSVDGARAPGRLEQS